MASEALVANGDDLTIRKFIALLLAGARGSSLHFFLELQSNKAAFFFNITQDLTLSCGGEGVATHSQNL